MEIEQDNHYSCENNLQWFIYSVNQSIFLLAEKSRLALKRDPLEWNTPHSFPNADLLFSCVKIYAYTMQYKHKQCKFHLSLPMNLIATLEGGSELILISIEPGIRHPTRIILMVLIFSISWLIKDVKRIKGVSLWRSVGKVFFLQEHNIKAWRLKWQVFTFYPEVLQSTLKYLCYLPVTGAEISFQVLKLNCHPLEGFRAPSVFHTVKRGCLCQSIFNSCD